MTTRVPDMPLTLVLPDSIAADVQSDAVLVGKMKDGDTRAAETLVLRYHRPLMGYLRRLGGQAAVAEELHQQTWLSVLQNIARFDVTAGGGGGGSFKSWLFRIATNKANDLWRRRKFEPAGDAALANATGPIGAGGESRAELTEETERLRVAITRLPEAQRQVLMLRYYGGLKFSEIAETLGCPLNTALGRMHKAMARLKVIMDDPGPEKPAGE